MRKIQSITPVVEFIHYDSGKIYQKFSCNSTDVSGKGLQGYTYTRDSTQFSGSFSLSVKEESNNVTLKENAYFADKVELLDIVKIYRWGNKPDFIGIVTNISYNSNSSGQRMIMITGKGIEFLFEFLTIALDTTAMAWAGKSIQKDVKDIALKLSLNGGKDPAKHKDILTAVFNDFCTVSNNFSEISNNEIISIINKFFTDEFLENQSFLNEKYHFPITSNLYSASTNTYTQFIRNLYPENVYELYGIIQDGKPKIRIREFPFSSDKWETLKKNDKKLYNVIDYSVRRGLDEVYTAFISYVEGGSLDPNFYNNLSASSTGYGTAKFNSAKIKKFGYKPLQCVFTGYNTEQAETEKSQTDLSNSFSDLNEKLSSWYGNLEEMYTADINTVDVEDINIGIGERLYFIGGEFYVTAVTHSWSYGSCPKVSYATERGGKYTKGNFSPLKSISKPLIEVMQ